MADFRRAGEAGWRHAELVVVCLSADCAGETLALCAQMRSARPWLPVVVIAVDGSEDCAIAALRAGVNDYIRYPASREELAAILTRWAKQPAVKAGPGVVGPSAQMREILNYIGKVASTDSNVLITGETGTGKELLAALIHQNSRRAPRSMVCVNCAAIPDALFESELFGFERGAFTGAQATTPGQLELANGGTVFLDEIGELSACAQAKLLRAIECKEIRRLGGRGAIRLDVRIIAATNRDVDTMALSDQFRKDLYFRLNVGRIHVPPLRERKDDIPALIHHYVAEMNRQFGSTIQGFDAGVLESMVEYEWPGNVRELRNMLESTFVSGPAGKITYHDLPAWFRQKCNAPEASGSEPQRVLSALEETNWNKSQAAARLNWSRTTLYRKMAQYELSQTDSREGSL